MKLNDGDVVTIYTPHLNHYQSLIVVESTSGSRFSVRPAVRLTFAQVEELLTPYSAAELPNGSYIYKSYDGRSERPLEIPQRILEVVEEAQSNVGPVGKVERQGKLKFDGSLLGDE